VRRTANAPQPCWSQWAPLDLPHRFTTASLRETLDGGQAFRWHWRDDHAAWQGVFGQHAAQLRLAVADPIRERDSLAAAQPRHAADDSLGTRSPATSLHFRAVTAPAVAREALRHYLGMAPTLDAYLARLPLSSDAVLASAIAACPGLILLRQPFAETLLAFILSSTKRIPQIRQCCEALAARFGKELVPGIHALPTWERLAAATEVELRTCALGFRAAYVHETAQFLAARPGWLHHVETAPYAEAKASLCSLPGVGEKIADCTLLFGAGRLEAFPVDVWILRTLAERYGLHGWRPVQLAQFGRAHFGPLAGLAQQYLFAAARSQRR
jgi:N-glycosylase/DNA lyase